ncbi:hypothetical protein [Chryseobacterium sp. SIMBA_038]|uniref:hypothetical protein n=1 Tax=Chryseobacterium sp. SIMBA_038 TaxID=3085780 RepID=UPI00397D8CD8
MKFNTVMLFSISSIMIFSCNKQVINDKIKETESIISAKESAFLTDSLKNVLNVVLKNNDTTEYQRLYKEFVVSGHKKEFLYYSMKMGELNNFGEAFFDTSTILEKYNYDSKFPHESKITLYYLLKAYEVGNENAKIFIKEMYLDKGLKVPSSISVLENN